MAKLGLCAVFDSKIGGYAVPFSVRSRGEAIRSFEDACRDEKMPFKAHPGDFSLFYVGEFDDSTGQVVAVQPERLIGADELGI